MKCDNCKCSVNEKVLHRTVPLGHTNTIWLCLDCMKKKKPNLAKKIISERTQIDIDLEEIFYGTKP